MTDPRDPPEKIVISGDDLSEPAPVVPPPQAAKLPSLPPTSAPTPVPPAGMGPGPGDLLSRLGRNTLVSGLVAGLVGGLLGMLLAETIGNAGEADDVGGSGSDDGSFYDASNYNGIELGTGDVQFTLTWDSVDDLDLHVFDPSGEEIYFGAPVSSSGGELDVDSNAGCGSATDTPVENVFWPTGESPSGQYRAVVNYWSDCDDSGPQSYELIALVDGEVIEQTTGTLNSPGEDQTAAEFDRDDVRTGGSNGRLLLARVIAWTVFGAIMGLGLGLRGGRRKIINGLIGGATGGAVGGLLFHLLQSGTESGTGGRLVSFVATGIGVGLGIGIVEHLRREAWLIIAAGPMAGKEFILYRPVTTVGSSPKCDIVLVKDHQVGPSHLALQRDAAGAMHAVSPAGLPVSVNGQAVSSRRLRNGDTITVGTTGFSYQERALAEQGAR